MRVAYISGPYHGDTIWETVQNIRLAEAVALDYWKKGYAVICPHKNSALFDGAAPESIWIAGDLEILSRCDVIVMIAGWRKSKGAQLELERARELGLEVIYDDVVGE